MGIQLNIYIYIYYKIDVRNRFGHWSKVWLDPSLTGLVQWICREWVEELGSNEWLNS